jgi:primary-amine oxidase
VADHPLTPLDEQEISAAVEIFKREHNLGEKIRFAGVVLHEPPKEQVLAFKPGDDFERDAHVAMVNSAEEATYEAVISLSEGKVKSWEHIPDVQPPIVLEEADECEKACKENPEFQEALRKRGIMDMDLVVVDAWSAGSYGDEEGRRLSRALTWVRLDPEDNP